jgi:cytochrome P450
MKLSLPEDMPSPLATSFTAVSLVSLYLFYTHKSSQTKKSIPDTPTSMFENVAGIGGLRAPFFILDTAKRLDSWNFRAFFPGISFYIIGEHRLVREILLDKTTDKPRNLYKNFEGTSTKTMFTSSNDAYMKDLRKSTAHAFSRNEVGRMNDIATKYVDEWLNGRLKDFAESGTPFDPAREFNRITFFVICEAAFEYKTCEDDFEAFEKNAELAQVEFIAKCPTNPLRRFFWWLIPSAIEARKSCEIMLDFAGRILESYRKKLDYEKSTASTLIKILDANASIASERQRHSEIKDWLTAGHDTTGYSLANTATLLAKHPTIQKNLQDELSQHNDSKKDEDCEYFRNVVKEAMRVMPVAAGGSVRLTGREYHLKNGTVLPKGAICFFNQYLTNHNPSVYGKDAESFVPERWEQPTEEMKVAMAPFAVGSRSCPGQSLAMSEINSVLPRLLAKYSLELVEEGEKTFFLTLKYKGTKLRAKKL